MEMETEEISKKRHRSENWLEEDKILLKELVKERLCIIENKNTDTKSNNKKMAAWTDLQKSFNYMCQGMDRTVIQLKNQWGHMKQQVKKQKTRNPLFITPTILSVELTEAKEEIAPTRECSPSPVIKRKKKNLSPTERVAIFDIRCRKELHKAQMDNEKKKAEILSAEENLIKMKLDYYKKKIDLL